MRLLVGKDYYDSGMAWGLDPKVTFVREHHHYLHDAEVEAAGFGLPTFEIEILDQDGKALPTDRRRLFAMSVESVLLKDELWRFQRVYVIAAGVLYSGVQVFLDHDTPSYIYFWDHASWQTWAQSKGLRLQDRTRASWWNKANTTLEDYFTPRDLTKNPVSLKWLQDHRITLLSCLPHRGPQVETSDRRGHKKLVQQHWRVNGDELKDMQFFKAVDPVSLYQQLSQWIGGVLPQSGPPMVEITDDAIKAAKHGMDQWSFRTIGQKSLPPKR